MQEQKKYQIERVNTYIKKSNKVAVLSYYPESDNLNLSGYYYEKNARIKNPYDVGMWRIKQQKLNH